MKRTAFCAMLVLAWAVCLAGGASQAQDLRMLAAPTSEVRLAAPALTPAALPPLGTANSNLVNAFAAPPAPTNLPGCPSSIMPSPPRDPAATAPNPVAEPSLGLVYDPTVNTWIDPRQSLGLPSPAASLDAYAIPPGNTNPPPAPPSSGWRKGGFLHGGLLRNFIYGNDAARAASIPGSNEVWGGFEDWAPPVAERTPRYGVYLWESYEGWRSIADGSTKPHLNNGPNQGINVGAPVPWLGDYGVGAQFGLSYGAFNPTTNAQQQTFITTGFFRRADIDRPASFGIVYDWMTSNSFGAYQQSFTLGQFRAQLAYAFTARNEIGIWGTIRNGQVNKSDPLGNPLQYRAISQGSLFWHHKFGPGGSDLWVAAGIPSFYRLGGNGDLDDFESNIFNGRLEVPVSDRWKFFTSFQGWRPTNAASTHSLFDVMSGVSFYPSGNARTRTVAGQSWMPYLPVANNGSFMVDTNQTF